MQRESAVKRASIIEAGACMQRAAILLPVNAQGGFPLLFNGIAHTRNYSVHRGHV